MDKCPSDDVLASVLDIANSEFAGKSYDDARDIIINHHVPPDKNALTKIPLNMH